MLGSRIGQGGAAALSSSDGRSRTMSANRALFLLFLILVCGAVNLTKAVHMDDAAYLNIAQAILRDPVHPMAQQLNWVDSVEPIHNTNQPLLLFYVMALVMALVGPSELVLHTWMAAMSAGVIVAFYLLARLVVPRHALFVTALFVLGPAFLPGQNLMVDVPLIGVWLLFFWALLSAAAGHAGKWYTLATACIAAACLVKYVSLVLVPIFVIVLLGRRHGRYLALLATPGIVLILWSWMNYLDYGGIHILERSGGETDAFSTGLRLLDWTAGLGAIAPFSVAFASRRTLRRMGPWLVGVILLVGTLVFFVSIEMVGSYYIAALWALFVANGLFVAFLACCYGVHGYRSSGLTGYAKRRDQTVVLALWIVATLSFTVLFAPFMAVRHILLTIPPLLLILAQGLQAATHVQARQVIALALTVTLGLLLAVSDYVYADVYRRYASQIADELGDEATVWYTGHWGWQWYADEAGMQQYDSKHTILTKGDYLVSPALPHGQALSEEHRQRLQAVRKIVVPASPLSWARTMSFAPAGGYYVFAFMPFHGPPWRFSTAPLETFTIWVVTDPAETGSSLFAPGTVRQREE